MRASHHLDPKGPRTPVAEYDRDMSELVSLPAPPVALPPKCACCLGEPDDASARPAKPLSVRVPLCRPCARHQARGRLRVALWIVLVGAGIAALVTLAPPRGRLAPDSRALLPASIVMGVVAAGAAAHLLLPRSKHRVERAPLSVYAASPEACTFLVHEPRYADLLAATSPRSGRQSAGVDLPAILLGLPFGGAWARFGVPMLSIPHATVVLVASGALLVLLWPRAGDTAALEALRRAPGLPAVKAFLADYPDSPHRDEVRDLAWARVSTSRDKFELRKYLEIPGAHHREKVQGILAELELAELDARPEWSRLARFAAENPGHARSAEFRGRLAASLLPAAADGTPPVEDFRGILKAAADGKLPVVVSGFANFGEHLAGVRKFVEERLKIHGITPTFVPCGSPATIVMVGVPSTVRYRAPGESRITEGMTYTVEIEVKKTGGGSWTARVEGDPPKTIMVRKGEEDREAYQVREIAYQGLMSKLWSGPLFMYPRAEPGK